jgi:hypothetical protein
VAKILVAALEKMNPRFPTVNGVPRTRIR